MLVRTLETIAIQCAGADASVSGLQSSDVPTTRSLRLAKTHTDQARTFTLHDGELDAYTLSVEELEHLLNLLGCVMIKAPWQPLVGRDGTDCELTLKNTMSSVTFRWWAEVPPGWDGVGAVFDYVMAISNRHRAVGK